MINKINGVNSQKSPVFGAKLTMSKAVIEDITVGDIKRLQKKAMDIGTAKDTVEITQIIPENGQSSVKKLISKANISGNEFGGTIAKLIDNKVDLNWFFYHRVTTPSARLIDNHLEDLRKKFPSEEFKSKISSENLGNIMNDMSENFGQTSKMITDYIFHGKGEDDAIQHARDARLLHYAEGNELLDKQGEEQLQQVCAKHRIPWQFRPLKYLESLLISAHFNESKFYIDSLKDTEFTEKRIARENKLREAMKEDI